MEGGRAGQAGGGDGGGRQWEQAAEHLAHDLRHTNATLALRRRVPVEVVLTTLEHARVSITLDIYRLVLESELRALLVNLFENIPVIQVALLSMLN